MNCNVNTSVIDTSQNRWESDHAMNRISQVDMTFCQICVVL